MPLKDRITFLTSPDQVDTFLARHPLAVIFKAGTCHQTDETFALVAPVLEARPDIPLGLVRVVESRPASNHIAERTGVRHESPQLLIFRDGQLATSRSRREITDEALTAALGARLTAV